MLKSNNDFHINYYFQQNEVPPVKIKTRQNSAYEYKFPAIRINQSEKQFLFPKRRDVNPNATEKDFMKAAFRMSKTRFKSFLNDCQKRTQRTLEQLRSSKASYATEKTNKTIAVEKLNISSKKLTPRTSRKISQSPAASALIRSKSRQIKIRNVSPIRKNFVQFKNQYNFSNKFGDFMRLLNQKKNTPQPKEVSEIKFPKQEKIEKSKELTRYVIGKQIGKGAYAVVKTCFNIVEKKAYAVKIYQDILSKDESKRRCVYKEIQILKALNHRNIIKVYEFFEENNSLYIIMERAKGIPLTSFLKLMPGNKFDEIRAKRVFTQLVSALAYLHRQNICHRDIKLDNIMIDETLEIKLIDFGFGVDFDGSESKLSLFCGTPSYMAPEIVKENNYYGPSADIWSSGILLYRILCGKFPFRGSTRKELFEQISKGAFTVPRNLSIGAHDILSKTLCVDPKERITAINLLRHEWIVNLMDIFRH